LGHVANRLQAICGKCGATVDTLATSDEFSAPSAWSIGDTTGLCQNQPWQRCPQLLAIAAAYMGQDMLDEQS
jgi:hypothetical protein